MMSFTFEGWICAATIANLEVSSHSHLGKAGMYAGPAADNALWKITNCALCKQLPTLTRSQPHTE
jgi:hypothetical protein